MRRAIMTAPAALTDLPPLVRTLEGFSAIESALQRGQSATIDGVWGSAAALVSASLIGEQPLLVVIAHPRDLDAWAGDLLSFSGRTPAILPAWDNAPGTGPLDDTAGRRLRLLKQLHRDDAPAIILATFQALMQPVPDRQTLHGNSRILRVGDTIEIDALCSWLVDHGYEHIETIEQAGQFSRRGGIVDIFAPDAEVPVRLEFFGDDIDSIRQFSPETQRSLGSVTQAEASGISTTDSTPSLTGHFIDHLPAGSRVVLVEIGELQEQGNHYFERLMDPTGLYTVEGTFSQLTRLPSVRLSALPSPGVEATGHLRVETVERLSGDVARIRDELDSVAIEDQVLIACENEGEVKRLGEVLAAGKLAESDRLKLVIGRIRSGFRLINETGTIVVLGGQELFHRESSVAGLPRRRLESRAIDSFLELSEGDLVVHVSHGIARYRGMQLLEKAGTGGMASRAGSARTEEHLILEFRDNARVYVPVSSIDVVQKYVGGAGAQPELSKMGGTAWQNKKAKVEAAVMDLAVEMIQLQAQREAQPGFAYPGDTEWQGEFDASFPFQETPDQLTTMKEIKADLERPRPMDRLVCGDVGFGKTELAIRAAFKAIDNSRQVAVLVPTTVLAEQHYRTFTGRMAEYPFVVRSLSRFRSGAEQNRIIEQLKGGAVDVIIGTHRLLSQDVQFKDLGLVIIDEEQRFGVAHKEKLKKLRSMVDVLTLTATPIPRTLHLSLLGIRDISNLETPPPDRLPIETRIVRFDPQLIRHAIVRELNREGQIYFVHNRVQDIENIGVRLREIVPEAKLAIVHGQMAERELERGMMRFVKREVDILLATTIIESGLDIPSANTMFINEADHYGLADMHQLRGRVGRSKNRAYCYLLLNPDKLINPVAAKRLKAMEEFSSLGAGFKISLRDLEIRGAGNILGNQQSGHIASVGYELYCQLLENAVRQMKQLPLRAPLEVNLDVPWTAYLPRDYVSGQKARIEVYRRLSRVRKLDRLNEFREELRDRFGAIPEPAEWLLRMQELRIRLASWKIDKLYLEGPADALTGPTYAVLNWRSERKIKQLAALHGGEVKVVDSKSAYYKLGVNQLEPEGLYLALRDVLPG